MQKKKYIYGCLISLFAVVSGAVFYYQKAPDSKTQDIWITDRNLPNKIDLPNYLNGNFARQQGDFDKALDFYLKVLKQDPENLRLLADAYTLAMIQGKTASIIPYLENLQKIHPAPKMFNYLQIAQAIKQGNTKTALEKLSDAETQVLTPLLAPLLKSWIYVKLGQKEKALSILNELDKNTRFHFAKAYQTFLIGSYLNETALKEKALSDMHGNRLPAIGYFYLLKKQIESQGKWSESDLSQQLNKMIKNYPATAELIQQFSETELTWDKGLAEIFYFVSADSADKMNKEEELFLNSIALYLAPNKQLALIWGAELNENLQLPAISLNYYEHLKTTNATLLFKKALLLQQLSHPQEAFKILKALQPKNQNSIPLMLQMAQIHLQNNQIKKALKIYTQILASNNHQLNNAELAKIYLLRANLYYQLQHQKQMMADFEKANILQPDDPMIQNDFGYNLLVNNQVEEGFQLIQKAFQKQPQSPYILDSMAFAYYKKNQPKTALPFAEKALTLMPQSALINVHLGEIYEALNRKREAFFQYQKALDLKNDLTPEIQKKLIQKIKN